MSEYTDWDGFADTYYTNLRFQRLEALEKRQKPEEDYPYDENHPAFLSPEYWTRERADAKLYLKRFQAKRGLIE